MEAFDFIILFQIAAWSVSFHAMMLSKNTEIARGRMYMAVFFGVLFVISIIIKMGVLS